MTTGSTDDGTGKAGDAGRHRLDRPVGQRADGGAAFPVLPPQDTAAGIATGYPYPEAGMTLRDYFAAKALPGLADALAAYWDAAYAEGRDGRTHDTEDGAAQRALNSVHDAVRDLLAAERERCARLCDDEFPRLQSSAERDLCAWLAQRIRKA